MELSAAVRRRRMVRSFAPEPVAAGVLDGILDLARRAPSAGNTPGTDLVVLAGEETAAYWDASLPADRRSDFPWPGLLVAPVLVVVAVAPARYVDRYAESDKRDTALGTAADGWPVPFWFVDAGMAVEALLLGAVDAGLGACFFGLFEHEVPVATALGVPDGVRLVGTVALGHPAPAGDRTSRSAARGRRSLDQVVHRGRWRAPNR